MSVAAKRARYSMSGGGWRRPSALRGLGFSILLLAGAALAQSGGGYDLHWNTQDGGGGAMSGANSYSLTGTLAQADASPAGAASGANAYVLRGGFWAGVHATNDVIFRDSFEASP